MNKFSKISRALVCMLFLAVFTQTLISQDNNPTSPLFFLDKRSSTVRIQFNEQPAQICLQKESHFFRSNSGNLSFCKPFEEGKGLEKWLEEFHLSKETRFGFYKETGDRVPGKVFLDEIEQGEWIGGIIRGKSKQAYLELNSTSGKKGYKFYPVADVENWEWAW